MRLQLYMPFGYDNTGVNTLCKRRLADITNCLTLGYLLTAFELLLNSYSQKSLRSRWFQAFI